MKVKGRTAWAFVHFLANNALNDEHFEPPSNIFQPTNEHVSEWASKLDRDCLSIRSPAFMIVYLIQFFAMSFVRSLNINLIRFPFLILWLRSIRCPKWMVQSIKQIRIHFIMSFFPKKKTHTHSLPLLLPIWLRHLNQTDRYGAWMNEQDEIKMPGAVKVSFHCNRHHHHHHHSARSR